MFTKLGFGLSVLGATVVYALSSLLLGVMPHLPGVALACNLIFCGILAAAIPAYLLAEDCLMAYAQSGRFFREFPQETWAQRFTLTLIAFFKRLQMAEPVVSALFWHGLILAALLAVAVVNSFALWLLAGEALALALILKSFVALVLAGGAVYVFAVASCVREEERFFDPTRYLFFRYS